MSLDVYLTIINRTNCPHCKECVSEAEEDVFDRNITHNLNIMAGKAGVYEQLWRPEEVGIFTAGQLIKPLTIGLKKLTEKPNYYKAFNPDNGWGTYEGLVSFISDYLEACIEYPEAKISTSK